MTVETVSAGLVAVKPRPPRLTRALSFHRMAAAGVKTGQTVRTGGQTGTDGRCRRRGRPPEGVFVLTETPLLAVHAVRPGTTHAVPAARPAEARLTQAAAVDVEAARSVRTVALPSAVRPVGARRAVLVTPAEDSTLRVSPGPEPHPHQLKRVGLHTWSR